MMGIKGYRYWKVEFSAEADRKRRQLQRLYREDTFADCTVDFSFERIFKGIYARSKPFEHKLLEIALK